MTAPFPATDDSPSTPSGRTSEHTSNDGADEALRGAITFGYLAAKQQAERLLDAACGDYPAPGSRTATPLTDAGYWAMHRAADLVASMEPHP